MPNINLSTLNGQELRRLLDATRRRGDAALSYQVLQEMALRREQEKDRAGLGLLKRRAREPHIIDVDLADNSIEAKDEIPPMPSWRPPATGPQAKAEAAVAPAMAAAAPAAAKPVPAPKTKSRPVSAPAPSRLRGAKGRLPRDLSAAVAAVDAEPVTPATTAAAPTPRSVWDAEPEPAPKPRGVWDAEPETVVDDGVHDGGLLLHPRVARPTGATASRRFPIGIAATLVIGVGVGMGAGWSARAMLREATAATAPPAARVQTAALQVAPAALPTPPPPPAPEPVAAPEAAPEPAAELPPTETAEAAAPSEAVDVATNEAVEPAPQPPPPERRKVEVLKTAEMIPGKSCAAELTPADREICADPGLGRLQRELRQAYADALGAHHDRDVLRQRQLAWRAARNEVSDPQQLARLYEARIRKLNAATAAARQQRD